MKKNARAITDLSEIRGKLLQVLAHGASNEDQLAKKLGIGREAVRFKAEGSRDVHASVA